MATPLRCPVCESRIRSSTPIEAGQEVECPQCGKVFLPDDLEVEPERPAEAPRPRASRRDRDERKPDRRPARNVADEEADQPRADRTLAVVALLGFFGCGGFLLLLVVGGLIWALSDQPAAPVAVAPPPAENAPAPNPPAPQPKLAQPNPAPDPVPPVAVPQPQPQPNPVPSKNATPENAGKKESLEKARRATARIQVEAGNSSGSGSGFLVRSNADAAYVVTNYHVIAVNDEEPAQQANPPGFPGAPPGFPGPPPGFPVRPPVIRPPAGFGPPAGMFPPNFGFPGNPAAPKQKVKAKVFVVLGSGTPEEQTHPAEIVAIDPEADLATLRITGARNLPAALDVTQEAPVSETMPVFIFGFPGGARNITVGEGKVSQLRRDENNALNDVQINGQINPGNSGGPVVDADGRLVGIAVSTVRGKNLGFAIPAGRLDHMLKGSLLGGLVFQVRQLGAQASATGELWVLDRKNKVLHRDVITAPLGQGAPATGPTEFVVLAALNDPMHKITAVTAHYPVATGDAPKPGPKGWEPLAGAQKIALQVRDAEATGTFRLPAGGVPDLTYAFQFSYTTADGPTVFTQPHPLRLTFPKNPKSVTLKIATPLDDPSRRFIDDTVMKTFTAAGGSVRAFRTAQGTQVEVDPVDDPKDVVAKIKFGEVVSVEGRTITVTVKKVELPTPTEEELTKALADLKAADGHRRSGGADRLAKVYVIVPERRAEIAKALEEAAVDKDLFLRHAALRALNLWSGPENVAGLVRGLEIQDGQTRSGICTIIAKHKDASAAAAVAKLLVGFERGAAATALKAMGSAAEKEVIPYLANKDLWAAREACGILKEIGTEASIAPLEEAKAKPDFLVNHAAGEALKAVQARLKEKDAPKK